MMFENLNDLLSTASANTSLGHIKRDKAFVRQIKNLCTHPGGTGSGASTAMADTISAYRFAANNAINLPELREARFATALKSCPENETLLVINDVSILNYCFHDSKSDRRAVGDGKGKGYEYVCNLGVTLESERYVGVLHDCLINEDGPDDTDQISYHSYPLFNELSKNDPNRLECNHKHILACHFKHMSDRISDRHIIEVADREFDDHFIFQECISANRDFVIRSSALRNVQVSTELDWVPKDQYTIKYPGLPQLPDHACVSMSTLVDCAPLVYCKSISLDANGRLTDEKSAKSQVNVSVGAFQVKLYRKAKRNQTYIEPENYVNLNVVVVKQTDPPVDGQDPIQWVIYTTLPVETIEEINKVVRIYELRWLIESFFKYLKSGFKLEDLRYDNARKTAVHIVAITIAATFLINLKRSVGLPVYSSKLTPEDYDKIKHAAKNPDDPNIDKDLRTFALIARQGGWRGRRTDPISPMTMIKGFERLTRTIEMLQDAQELIKLLTKEYQRE
jgi:hypothetical protein